MTFRDIKSGMQCVKEDKYAQGLLGNHMDVVGHSVMGVLASLCIKICTKHFGHDDEKKVTVTFVKLGYVMGGFLPSLSDFLEE